MTEHMLQSTCIQYINDKYPNVLMWASLNGIKLDGKNKYGTITREKQAGFLPGVPDTTICIPNGVTLHVEFKTPKGVQSEAQKQIQTKLESLNHLYFIIRTFQEFKTLLQQYIKD